MRRGERGRDRNLGRDGLLAALLVMSVAPPHSAAPANATGAGATSSQALPLIAEHRYRIVGRVRLLLFWIHGAEVGGARLTWRGNSNGRALSLLIGSDPARAPRSLNEWGYLREQVRGDTADVFGVRTLQDADSVEKAKARLADQSSAHAFGVLCSSISSTEARSVTTTVTAPRDVSYAAVGRLLDAVETSEQWNTRNVGRPAGSAPGFLNAVDRLIHDSLSAARHTPSLKTIAFVYKGEVYDLRLESAEPTDLEIGQTVYRNLIRGTFAVHDRVTGHDTEFTVTYGVDGPLSGVPVQAAYNPHWWLKVELTIDDGLAVPPDPDGDHASRDRIEVICARRH
jgi:hypothetical protein